MGTTLDDGSQQSMWVATADLPQGGGHPFYERLNQILRTSGFDAFVENLCAGFYARMGRPSLAPGRYSIPGERRRGDRTSATVGSPSGRCRRRAPGAPLRAPHRLPATCGTGGGDCRGPVRVRADPRLRRLATRCPVRAVRIRAPPRRGEVQLRIPRHAPASAGPRRAH